MGDHPLVAVVMGSKSDASVMQGCLDTLEQLGIPHETAVLSAHRTPEKVREFAVSARERGIEVVDCGRGGDITYHGPGQLVAYPILALRPHERDLRGYLRALEGAVIRALSEVGIGAQRRQGLTGVWVGEAKICAIGIRVEAWVSSHGLALNISNDLSPFGLMHPCGLRNGWVTSVAEATGRTALRQARGRPERSREAASVDDLIPVLARTLGEVLGRRVLWPGGDN